MNIDEILRELKLEDAAEQIRPGWVETCAASREGDFLTAEELHEACRYVGLKEDVSEQLETLLEMVRQRPALEQLARHGQRRLFHGGPAITTWPLPNEALGELSGLFGVLILLSGWNITQQIHRQHRIPDDVVKETMADLQLHLDRSRQSKGHYELEFLIAGGWLKRHFLGTLYQLGRLQFIHRPLGDGFRAYRNQQDGTVIALVEDGVPVRTDGYLDGASGITDADAWESRLETVGDRVKGNPIDPRTGAVSRESVVLPCSDWQTVLGPGDAVLDIHIPESGPMTPALCRESTERAIPFYQNHFGDLPAAKAFFCTSWLLDVQLKEILKPESNILHFLEQFYLTPASCDPWAIVRSIFGVDIPYGSEDAIDLDQFPRQSSLQRGILEHIEHGKRWRKSGGFLLVEDLPWGRSPYCDHFMKNEGSLVE